MQHNSYFITGSDTEVGKTFVSAIICLKFGFDYWKPIQSGSLFGNDTDFISSFKINTHKPLYSFLAPEAPNITSKIENLTINTQDIIVPKAQKIIVEGAGGVMSPITNSFLIIDLIKQLNLPVIFVAKTSLGTINHTLLSIYALQKYDICIHGIILNGQTHAETKDFIANYCKIPILVEIPNFTINAKNVDDLIFQ